MLHFLFVLLLQVYAVVANTEKAIFLGPRSLHVPSEHPSLEDLKLEALSPQQWSIRTHIKAEFPTNSSKYGQSSWMLLHKLHEGQRYEVRICWAATQPTSFRLDTYELQHVFETAELITSLAQYSETRQLGQAEVDQPEDDASKVALAYEHTFDDISSMLFLHIQAAADYYTMNHTLMKQVPPVYVDIILDPFVLNALPRSLLPTVAYIIILAAGSWFLSKRVNKWIQFISVADVKSEKKES